MSYERHAFHYSPPPPPGARIGAYQGADMNTKISFFVMMVYNNWTPRNWDKMNSDLRFVTDALIAMGND
jgi:hypothetical protein